MVVMTVNKNLSGLNVEIREGRNEIYLDHFHPYQEWDILPSLVRQHSRDTLGTLQVNKPKPSVIHLTNLASGNQSQESLEMHHLHSTSTNIGS
jgi:hypothetical protein